MAIAADIGEERAYQAIKYPKTPHLPFSPGVHDDDIVLSASSCVSLPFLKEEAVVTEKLDGGNCSIFRGKVYARTVSSEAMHASFGPIKQLAAEISYSVPHNIQLFGENMFGVHSIEYDGLTSFFYLLAALENGSDWLAWDHVTELANEIGVPTVPILHCQNKNGHYTEVPLHPQSQVVNQFASLEEVESVLVQGMQTTSYCGSCHPEGFVIRTVGGFPYASLESHVAKYVRAGHVQTDETWRRTWKQAKLKHKYS